MKTTRIILTVVFCLLEICGYAQTEFFVEVDPQTGNFTKINKMPGVNWIQPGICAYDATHHHYIFCGSPDTKKSYLYTIDATTGEILSSPLITFPDTINSLYNLEYNNADGNIYCIHYNGVKKIQYFSGIDAKTGLTEDFFEIQKLKGSLFSIGFSAIDNEQQLYFIAVHDTTDHLYTIDLKTKAVVNKVNYDKYMYDFVYHKDLRKIIGIHSKHDSLTFRYSQYLTSLDPLTGYSTIISDTFYSWAVYAISHDYAIDEKNNYYSAVLYDTFRVPRLYTIDMNSGKVISNPTFYQTRADSDNVICFQYDNSLNKLFAIHWEAKNDNWQQTSDSMMVYPNPFTDETTIGFRKTYKNVSIQLFNESRQYIGSYFYNYTPTIYLKRNGLPAGVYYAKVYNQFGFLGTVKLVAR